MQSLANHDSFFKSIFRDEKTTAVHVRNTLPAVVVDQLDLDAMVRRPGSFVDAELRERHADLLFEVPFRGGEGRAFVHVIFEHQSTSDPLMPLRLLRYMLRIWDDLLAGDKGRRSLPPILPLVLHHSDTGWQAPTEFRELFEGPNEVLAALAPNLPQFRFLLTDLSTVDDAELRGSALYRVACLLLKHASDGDLRARLPAWLALLAEVAADNTTGLRAIHLVVEYILRIGDLAVDELVTVIRHVHPDMPQIIETTADRLHKAGELEGLEKGLEKGREQGRLEGQAELVVRALEARGVSLSDDARERILACRDADALQRWFDRALVVAAVADLFADDDQG